MRHIRPGWTDPLILGHCVKAAQGRVPVVGPAPPRAETLRLSTEYKPPLPGPAPPRAPAPVGLPRRPAPPALQPVPSSIGPPGRGGLLSNLNALSLAPPAPGWTSGDGRNYPNGRQMPVRSLDDLQEAQRTRAGDVGAAPSLEHAGPLLSANMPAHDMNDYALPDWATVGRRANMGRPVNPPIFFREADNAAATRVPPVHGRFGRNRLYGMDELRDMNRTITDDDIAWLARPFAVARDVKPWRHAVGPILTRGMGAIGRMTPRPLHPFLDAVFGSGGPAGGGLYGRGYRNFLEQRSQGPILDLLRAGGQLFDDSNLADMADPRITRVRPYDDLGAYREYIQNSR